MIEKLYDLLNEETRGVGESAEQEQNTAGALSSGDVLTAPPLRNETPANPVATEAPMSAEQKFPDPDGFAHEYPNGIRYGTGGRTINGCDPVKTIRLYWESTVREIVAAQTEQLRQELAERTEARDKWYCAWKETERGRDQTLRELSEARERIKELEARAS